MQLTTAQQGKLEANIRRFLLFRLFYAARFYYPVFTVLFLDYGLTLEQFSILGLVWALTIVLAEVPSGALADVLGRKPLIVFAAALMVLEMLLIVFAPVGPSALLFLLFLGNRLCSGLSEAAASGADEALTYDSLKALGRENDWPAVLERSARWVAVGFSTTMLLGALVYDPAVVNALLGRLNNNWSLAESTVIRLPLVLTLLTALCALLAVLGLFDPGRLKASANRRRRPVRNWRAVPAAFRRVWQAAQWTLQHRFVLFVILAALALDSVGRQFVVLSSAYWRAIDIPLSWFGVVGAGLSLLGIVNARISHYLVTRQAPLTNFLLLSAILMSGLLGLTLALPLYGVLFAVGAFAMMSMVQYQSSFYINRAVDSNIRATVLSFRGLALNLGLGLSSLLYTALVAGLKAGRPGDGDSQALQQAVFLDSLLAFPLYYLLLFSLILALAACLVQSSAVFLRRPARACHRINP